MSHARTPAADPVELINALDAWLPQTQCTRCGYPRCRDYAEALARGETGLNRCPPGGAATIAALARLLDRPALALDPACGVHEPRVRALIDETACIGCRKCLDACPVDAIVGARKCMHTVIENECNGCGLCVPPCPVDCIVLVPILTVHAQSASGSPPSPSGRRDGDEGAPGDNPWPEYSRSDTGRWRARTERRLARLTRRKTARTASAKKGTLPPLVAHPDKRSGAVVVSPMGSRRGPRARDGAVVVSPMGSRRGPRAEKEALLPPVVRPDKKLGAVVASNFPDRATIRAEIGAALERARARRRRDNPA